MMWTLLLLFKYLSLIMFTDYCMTYQHCRQTYHLYSIVMTKVVCFSECFEISDFWIFFFLIFNWRNFFVWNFEFFFVLPLFHKFVEFSNFLTFDEFFVLRNFEYSFIWSIFQHFWLNFRIFKFFPDFQLFYVRNFRIFFVFHFDVFGQTFEFSIFFSFENSNILTF